jgi:hypothetical protein
VILGFVRSFVVVSHSCYRGRPPMLLLLSP